MIRRVVSLLAVLFLVSTVVSAFGQTEDEIVANYLKKAEKKQEHARKNKIGFFSVHFAYGKLPDKSPNNLFVSYSNSRIRPLDAGSGKLEGAYRSDQIGINAGMMVTPKLAFKVNFEYWLKMGSNTTGNYNFAVEPLGVQNDFNLRSEMQVLGFGGGLDYYLLNPPDKDGHINSLSLRVGGGGGYYMAKWDIWQGSSSFNLSTQTYDANAEPIKGNAGSFYGSVGIDYPIRFFDMVLGMEGQYQYLNFKNVHSYNTAGDELYLTYTDSSNDRVDIDFSGLRAKIELRKFFRW
ncbi:exported hypothetical protein [Candidatus Zixiibacteriota bacterium]|nr:exported hypothetical protein [candidate division Zixibacteria bacterium]